MDEKVGRTIYVLEEKYAHGGDEWREVARSYFEDDMNEEFNRKYEINGHDTYYRIVERRVIREA